MKKIIFLTLSIIILLSACSVQKASTRNYYVLESHDHHINKDLIQKEPLSESILIRRTKVMDTYDRRQIAKRYFGPQLTYSSENIWATKLSEAIPRIIGNRLDIYHVFKEVKFSYELDKPDYELDSFIHNVEFMLDEQEQIYFARLKMTFNMKSTETGRNVINHEVDNKTLMQIEDYALFVQEINDIILLETDKFTKKIIAFLNNDVLPEQYLENLNGQSETELIEIASDEKVKSGTGVLFLPALTRTENEPFFTVIDQFGFEQTGIMGQTLPLLSGKYSLIYGSGVGEQLMEKEIEIFPRYKTVINPDWSCLVVTIIDDQRNLEKARYELFDGITGDSYGFEIPADTDIGEKDNVWVLKPGLFKITINDQPFNTYTDFTTVFLEKGKVQKLTIVIKSDEGGISVVGAGILDEDIGAQALENLRIHSAIHGNFNMVSSEVSQGDYETTINFTSQMESRVVFDSYPYYYNMKNLIELGTSKNSEEDFRVAADDFDLKNTLIYYLEKRIGIYARFDATSHFFNEYAYKSKDTILNYVKKNSEGEIISQVEDADRVLLAYPLFPISLKEGLGVNWRVVNSRRADLNIRSGFGMRQDIKKNVYSFVDEPTQIDTISYRTYLQEKSEYKTGIEVSVIGNMSLPFNINYDLNADILMPFDKKESISMDVENIINMRLLKYLSLDYRLKLSYIDPEVGDSYFNKNHTLFLRLTYVLR